MTAASISDNLHTDLLLSGVSGWFYNFTGAHLYVHASPHLIIISGCALSHVARVFAEYARRFPRPERVIYWRGESDFYRILSNGEAEFLQGMHKRIFSDTDAAQEVAREMTGDAV